MPKDEEKAGILKYFKRYGFNAILGFGLGVGIVLLSLTLGGQDQFGKKASGEAQAPQLGSQDSKEISASQEDSINKTPEEKFPSVYGEPIKSSRFTILLVGMDNRPEDISLSNTDSLIVASIDQAKERISFLSIPRDTQVNLPGAGIQKINAIARVQKGFPSTQVYIESMIGFPIDGYVVTNFNGFKSIIDSLGGITLTVEKNMHYDTGDSQDRYIDLKKGTQRVNGSQALQYARFRNDEMGDISRTARQQAVVKAMISEATNLKNLPKLPFVIPKVYQAVQTDLSIGQLWSLASLLNKTENYQIISQTLPGKFAIEKGISYWKVNSSQVQKVVTKLFVEGRTTAVFTSASTTPKGTSDTKDLADSPSESSNSTEVFSSSLKSDSNQEIQFEVLQN